MRLRILAAASALLTVSCAEPETDAASCLKRADQSFDKCVEEKGEDCTQKRLREQAICDRQRGAPAE